MNLFNQILNGQSIRRIAMLSDLLRKMTIALIMMLVSIPALLIIFIYNLVDYIKNIKDYEKRE